MNAQDGLSYYREVSPELISSIDPYVYQALQSLKGKKVVVETVRGSVRGNVQDVKPDHVVVQAHGSSFYIRTAQIVWVMPT
ncbi:YuzF family protein [Bacillus horti]|uniref:Aconitase with swiveling domain n=1 Tax=Caldalkalibacillus horti TaxID=77523 RepID=A0ABT9VYW3_9BACI|nr:YuzF family protein [Bacillus horti]MDQ0165795.1 putative aconitase with swiveling domain [Bacillus horti]